MPQGPQPRFRCSLIESTWVNRSMHYAKSDAIVDRYRRLVAQVLSIPSIQGWGGAGSNPTVGN